MRVPGFARNPYDRFFVALGHIDAAERAVADGCDAIFIDTFADYGMAEIRAAVPVPVIGAGESGIVAASANGTRDFSIVTVWPLSMNYLYKERLDNSPGGNRCLRVEHVLPETELQKAGTDGFIKNRMERHESAVIDLLAARVQQVADESGVGTILLGCTCMAPVGPAIQERVDVEVIEGTRNGLAVAFATLAAPRHGAADRRRVARARHRSGVTPRRVRAVRLARVGRGDRRLARVASAASSHTGFASCTSASASSAVAPNAEQESRPRMSAMKPAFSLL